MSRVMVVALAACTVLAACAGGDVRDKSPVVEALLQPAGGGPWQGSAKFSDRGDGVLVTLYLSNVAPGTYRLAIHANGNCSSPNFFSAGAAWAPTTSTQSPSELTPEVHTNSEGDLLTTFRIANLRITGPDSLQGRAVVLHWGHAVADATPGVRNDRVLCGVIGPVRSFLS